MGYTTFTTYQLVSRIFWTINFVSLKFESPNRCCTWLTWLNQLVKPGFSAPSTVVPLISSVQPSRGSVRRVCLGNFQPNVVVFPQKKNGWVQSPKDLRKLEFWEEKKAQQVFVWVKMSPTCVFFKMCPLRFARFFVVATKMQLEFVWGVGKKVPNSIIQKYLRNCICSQKFQTFSSTRVDTALQDKDEPAQNKEWTKTL